MVSKRLAVCVPYRDRETQLQTFIPHLEAFLKHQGIDFQIFIIHQANSELFNRGMLKNIGYALAEHEGFDYMAFHDVDLLPVDESCDYTFPEHQPVHLATHIDSNHHCLTYATYFGGVVLFDRAQFRAANGYANSYWAWGAEDDDLYSRCLRAGLVSWKDCPIPPQTLSYARFGAESQGWLHLRSPRMKALMDRNYTVSLWLKPTLGRDREDLPSLPHSPRYFQAFPLLARHSLPILTHSQLRYFGHHTDRQVEMTLTSQQRPDPLDPRPTGWEVITLSVNVDQGHAQLQFNDQYLETATLAQAFAGSRSPIQGVARAYHDTPLAIGFGDVPRPGWPALNHFHGDIARLTLWDRALDPSELATYFHEPAQAQEGRWDIHFTGPHQETEDYQLSLEGTTFHQEEAHLLQGMPLPARRPGRYQNIDFRSETQKRTENDAWTSANQEALARFWSGLSDPLTDGLRQISFSLLERVQLTPHTVMAHVTFPGPNRPRS